jgi:hypothetical protein
MSFFNGVATLLTGTANTIVSGVGNKRNREQQERINQYNAEQNRLNLQTQMAYNSASQLSQRQYDSPREQLARLSDAGVNAFTAQDMIGADTGIGSGSVSPPVSNAQAYQSNFNLDSLVDAVKEFDKMQFTKTENQKDRKATEDNLLETLDNAIDLEDMKIKNSQVMQSNQFLHDMEVMAKQQEYYEKNTKDSQTFMQDFEESKYRLQEKLLKVGHENSLEMLRRQNEFTKDENQKDREYKDREWLMQSHYRKKEYEHRKEEDSKWVEDEQDLSIPSPHLKRKTSHRKWFTD